MKLRRDIWGRSIVGARDSQQDCFRLLLEDELGTERETLVVLADGMGGHRGGAEASQIVVETFARSYRQARGDGGLRDRLRRALQDANLAVRDAVARNDRLRGMGSTLAAAVVRPHRVIWTSVGDSPIWLWRRGRLRRLNADHSMRSELDGLVEAGRLTAEEAARHPQRNALRSAVCGEPLQLVDVGVSELADGDIVLLASDGVQTLSDAKVAALLDGHESDSATALVERCLHQVECSQLPHQDNATLVICKYGEASLVGRLGRAMPLGVVYGAVAGLIVIGAAAGGYAWYRATPTSEAGRPPAQEPPAPPVAPAPAATAQSDDWQPVTPPASEATPQPAPAAGGATAEGAPEGDRAAPPAAPVPEAKPPRGGPAPAATDAGPPAIAEAVPPAAGATVDGVAAPAPTIDVDEVRNFIGPDARLPDGAAEGFALVALTEQPALATRQRYLDLCTAFLATLVADGDPAIVTYWPIGDPSVSVLPAAGCDQLIDGYNFFIGLDAVRDVDHAGRDLVHQRGPFLLGFAPPASGAPAEAHASVILDLSDYEDQADFREVFACWRAQVVDQGAVPPTIACGQPGLRGAMPSQPAKPG